MSRIDTPLPAAVAAPIVPLLAGPLQQATVAMTHPAAVIVRIGPGDSSLAAPRVVTVLTDVASGVPNGMRTMLRAADRPFRQLVAGDAVTIGDGHLRLPGFHLRGVRVVPTAVPRVLAPADAVTHLAARAATAARGVDSAPVDALRRALSLHDGPALSAAVRALVGLGTGSTPGGDDVLCGAMAGLHATGRADLVGLVAATALQDVTARTPLLSADLLRLASHGNVCAEAGAVVRAVGRFRSTRSGAGALDAAMSTLLAIGHTSGADLATGLAVGIAVGMAVGSPAGEGNGQPGKSPPDATSERAGTVPAPSRSAHRPVPASVG